MMPAHKTFSATTFRKQFPALKQLNSLYLDSATTALKCQAMIDATHDYYCQHFQTIPSSSYTYNEYASELCDNARQFVAQFIHAPSANNIIWTSGATASVNLITQGYVRNHLHAGDEIIVSEAEHNSNILPWLIVAKQIGAKVIKLPVNVQLEPDLSTLPALLNPRSKLLVITQQSNVTGANVDLEYCIQLAHANNTHVIVDGSQGIVHQITDVQKLDIDCYFFSAHKLYGPTGLGVLYGKTEFLAQIEPYFSGSKIIHTLSFERYTLTDLPQRLEPGTPNTAGIIGFGATLAWLNKQDLTAAEQYSCSLAAKVQQQLETDKRFIFYNHSPSTLLTFNYQGIHYVDLAEYLLGQGVALREGHFCAHPLIQAIQPPFAGAIRLSFAPYNTEQEVEKLLAILHTAINVLQ